MGLSPKRKLIVSKAMYKNIFLDEKIAKANPSLRYMGLHAGVDLRHTEQGYDYWMSRYYWLAEQDVLGYKNNGHAHITIPMSEEDWAYLRSLDTPVDAFLEAPENKEFLV